MWSRHSSNFDGILCSHFALFCLIAPRRAGGRAGERASASEGSQRPFHARLIAHPTHAFCFVDCCQLLFRFRLRHSLPILLSTDPVYFPEAETCTWLLLHFYVLRGVKTFLFNSKYQPQNCPLLMVCHPAMPFRNVFPPYVFALMDTRTLLLV